MAEKSLMWTTGALGDGAAEYTMAELIRWLRQTYLSDNTDEGVLKNYGGALAVSGIASPVSIAAGGALIYGFPYWLTAATTMAIPSPAGAVRIDRIVLSADWVTQTVRLERVAGAEGGAAPALTQVDGTEWQISLAQCSITVPGVITVTDERVFVHPNWEIEAAQLGDDLDGDGIQGGDGVAVAVDVSEFAGDGLVDDGAENLDVNPDGTTIELGAGGLQIVASGLDASHIANRTRRVFVPATWGNNITTGAKLARNTEKGFTMPNAAESECFGQLRIPADWASDGSFQGYLIGGGVGDAAMHLSASYGGDGEAYNTWTRSSAATRYIDCALDRIDAADDVSSIVFTMLSAGDIILFRVYRDGTDIGDSLAASVFFFGFVFSYTADM